MRLKFDGISHSGMHMTSAVSVGRTNNQDIDGVLSGQGWDSRYLTYSFPAEASLYGDAMAGERHATISAA
jgi:hypothetical protein